MEDFMTKYYISTYYINAYLNNEQSEPSSVIHLVLYIGAVEEEKMFYVLEENTKKYLENFQNMHLSECIAFRHKKVTLESVGEFFYGKLSELLKQQGAELYQIEVYTTPTRRYKVSDRLLLPFQYPGDVVKRIEHIREWSQRLYSAGKEEVYEEQKKN